MIWGMPAAWFGLAALAVPLLVHLLARRLTRRVAFPTLRFIDQSRLTPTRRRRFTDPLLLTIRSAVVVAAVAGLAQPWWTAGSRLTAAGAGVVRAVIVDTSASMNAPAPDGRSGVAAARAAAGTLATDAGVARVIESDDIARALTAAAAWLGTRGGTREIVVFSDFQRGGLEVADTLAVAPEIGLRLERVPVAAPVDPDVTFALGDRRVTATVAPGAAGVEVRWASAPSTMPAAPLEVETAPDDVAAARALLVAARRYAAPRIPGGPTTVVLAGAPNRSGLFAGIRPIDQPWMFDALDAIRRDEAVRDASRVQLPDGQGASPLNVGSEPLLPVVIAPDGRPLVRAAAVDIEGAARLVIALDVGIAHPLAAAVMAAVPSVQAPSIRPEELDVARLDDAALARLSREPTAVPATAADRGDASDGRWFWLAALLLLGLEARIRRQPGPATAASVTRGASHARVA